MQRKKDHILIVEDELHTRSSLSLILQGGGYHVSLAQNGAEALGMLENLENDNDQVDMILTDILMPEMKGDKFIKTLKDRGISIPVIAMTGYGTTDTVDTLMRYGCKGYIEKPFESEKLLNRVRKVLDETMSERKEGDGSAGRIAFELETYKRSASKLREQIDSAVDVYQSLVQLQPVSDEIRISWKNRPVAKLGGDFVDVGKIPNGYDVFLADVSGHDIASSYHTILLKAFFEENCRKGNDGKILFDLLNRHLLETGNQERMISALFVRIDLERMEGEAVSAAHPPLIHEKSSENEVLQVTIDGDVLGIYQNPEFGIFRFDLTPGDRLFLYTDGVTGISRLNVKTGYSEKLQTSGLCDFIRKQRSMDLDVSVNGVWDEVLGFSEKKPGDDMLLFALEIPSNPR